MQGHNVRIGGTADLRRVLEARRKQMLKEVEEASRDYLLGISSADYAAYLVDTYRLEVLSVDPAEPTLSIDEERVQRRNPFFDTYQEVVVPAYRLHIPFTGSAELLQYQASTHSLSPPVVRVWPGELVVTVFGEERSDEHLKRELEAARAAVVKAIGWLRADVDHFNERIENEALKAVEQRREKILSAEKRGTNLGFALKERPGAPATYVVPDVRRKVVPRPPQPQPGAAPDPTLAMEEYENILRIIGNMVHVMERSPHAFTTLDEEDLRTHFLVQLNGQYEGQATGETFNYEGKTDILIRFEGRNVFIAECKIWRGEEEFKRAISQLLGYTAWRDTKAAVLVFNRNKDFSAVLGKIKAVLTNHEGVVKILPYGAESGFRAVMRHRDDSKRHLTVTVLAFDVPSNS